MEKELYGSLFLFGFLALFANKRWRWFAYTVCAIVIWGLGKHWLNAFVAGIFLCDGYVLRDHLPRWVSDRGLAWIGVLRASRVVSITGTAALMMLIGLPNHGGVLHLLLALLVSFWVLFSEPINAAFSRRLPVFLGKISFGLYLCHFPLICSFGCWVTLYTRGTLPHAASAATSVLLTMAVSLAGGYLLYAVADRPSLGISKTFSSAVIALANRGSARRP